MMKAFHGKCHHCGHDHDERWDDPQSAAANDVLVERERQKTAEGWTPAHDDEHGDGSMADAAACYAMTTPAMVARFQKNADGGRLIGKCPSLWPDSWHPKWWKPKDRRRDLVRAAALLLAEIERLDRKNNAELGAQT